MSILTDPAPTSIPAPGAERSAPGGRLTDLVWLTWRQHRTTITASIALIAVLTASILDVAARITTINQQCGNAVCADNSTQYAALHGSFGLLQVSSYLTITVLFLPLLIGVFLGVPILAREHEQRTLLLAWSQDITPQRWLWTKLALLAGLTAALSAAAAAACDHLAHVLSIAEDQSLFSDRAFQVTGMLPLTLSVVWLVVGVALGAAIRRTLPAAFAALAGYIGLIFLVQWRYPTFRTPLSATTPVVVGRQSGVGSDPNSLQIVSNSGDLVDAAGHQLSPGALEAMCPQSSGPQEVPNQCLAQHNIYSHIQYQPGSRIPEFHLILTGGYLAIGVIAVASLWWLVRRTSLSAG
jgi:hypothetical protein